MAESRHDSFVVTLGLAVSLRMIGCCCFVVDSKDGADGFPEFGYELWAIIGQD